MKTHSWEIHPFKNNMLSNNEFLNEDISHRSNYKTIMQNQFPLLWEEAFRINSYFFFETDMFYI